MKIAQDSINRTDFTNWTLDEVVTNPIKREARYTQSFSQVFQNPPHVFLSVTGFNINHPGIPTDANLKVTVYGDPTTKNFTIQVEVAHVCRLNDIKIDWIAISEKD